MTRRLRHCLASAQRFEPDGERCVTGDEILGAKVVDSNTYFLCKELHAIGWRVSKVCGRQFAHMLHLRATSFACMIF